MLVKRTRSSLARKALLVCNSPAVQGNFFCEWLRSFWYVPSAIGCSRWAEGVNPNSSTKQGERVDGEENDKKLY